MLSIKTKLKINQIKQSIDRNICKMLRFIFKPLIVFENKINSYKYKKKSNKLKKLSSQLTDEDVIKLVTKDIINKELVRYPSYDIVFDYEYGWYDDDTLITYIRKSKNKILRVWECELNYEEHEKKNNELLALLKKELSKYPEIEFKDYQKDKYYPKKLIIKLRKDDK